MNRLAALGALSGVFVFGLVLQACGGNDHPGTAGSVRGPGGGSDGGSDGGNAFDGAGPNEAGPSGDLCKNIALGPRVTSEIGYVGTAPSPLGGVLVTGTYDLESLEVYGLDGGAAEGGEGSPTSRLTGQTGNATVILMGTTIQIVQAFGPQGGNLGAPTARGYEYKSPTGTTLDVTQVCPAQAAAQPLAFTAGGGALAIFPDATHREIYRPRP